MTTSGLPNRPARPRPWALGSILLLLVGTPLLVFHAGLLFERAMHLETLDTLVVMRWTISLVFLIVLRSGVLRLRALDTRTLGIALLLVVTMIHAPAGVPEPALPMAAAGFGLALTLALLEVSRGPKAPGLNPEWVGPGTFANAPTAGTRRSVKDRAPPASR